MIPYTTIPFISAFFLVLVGVLIAHLIWHRSRDEHRHVALELQRRNDDLNASLQTQVGEYVQLQEERQVLEEQLGDARRQSTELQERLNQGVVERTAMSEQLGGLAGLQAESQRRRECEKELRQQLTVLQAANQQASEELQQLRHDHQQVQQQRDDLQIRVHDLQRQQQQLQDQLRLSEEQYDAQSTELQAARQQAAAGFEQLQRRHGEALAAETSLREMNTQLRDELACRVERLEILQEEKEQALAQAGDERKRRARVEQSLEAVRGTLDQLQSDNEALASSRQEALQQVEELSRRAERRGLSKHHRPAGASYEPPDGKIAFSFQQMQPKKHTTGEEDVSETIEHPLLGLIYRTAPQQSDDLKEISGIADVLEEKLNQLGVYTYQQIMEWTDGAVVEVTRLLCLEDRVQRDDWLGQARRLYHQYYRAA